MSDEASVYFGGIPVAPDVEKLFVMFEVPDPGTLITYAEIEEVIEIRRERTRFTTVVTAWRKKLLDDHNRVTEAVRNEGILVLTPKRRVRHVVNKNKSIFRQARKTYGIAVRTDPTELDDIEKKKLEANARCAQITCDAYKKSKKLREEGLTALPWEKKAE